ncbi:OmpA family protein [Methylotenera sp.]|uniref:OmpA family protein n=2 Tax=Methylotenera sp. TaxID=2051956 RepID=UPI0027210E84|nr:OmpA family protein [Methylotenera sp.]MDO9205710.1 OmpA family protein [Methylotenera sp.]MDO9392347.1 OmpA family protein [Methylotenera sp.]MDP2070055.1 OmpA family protein [Methylotenera sp.]MDP2230021.1 OmpA family protein [Methylotenera sp.]MDP3006492.1 OmpA family protein [Methylotenera sp.]
MRNKIIVSSILVAFSLGGCANMTETQKGTAKGAAIGAGAGAVVGAIAGKGKGAAIGAAVGGAAGAVAGNVWSKRQEEQKKQMEEATAGTGVAVTQTADNRLKLDIPSDISFAVGRADINPNFRAILNTFANGLVSNPSSNVTIIGHTDSTGTDAINNPLSLNRAASVRDYLTTRGVALNRFTIDGRGSREPIAANDTAANKAKNRRVEIYVAEPAQASQGN